MRAVASAVSASVTFGFEFGQLLRHRVKIDGFSKRGDGAFQPCDFGFEFHQRALRTFLFVQRPFLFVEPRSAIAEFAFGPNPGFGCGSRLNLRATKRFGQTRLFGRAMGRRGMIMGTTDRARRPFGQLFGQNDRLRARKPCLGLYQGRLGGSRRFGSCRQFARCRFDISLGIRDSFLRLCMRRRLDPFPVDLGQFTSQFASRRLGLSRLFKRQIGRIALRLEPFAGLYGLGQRLLRRSFVLRSLIKRFL